VAFWRLFPHSDFKRSLQEKLQEHTGKLQEENRETTGGLQKEAEGNFAFLRGRKRVFASNHGPRGRKRGQGTVSSLLNLL